MALIDTHCHLYLPEFNPDLEAVIERALDCGVDRMVVVGIDAKTSQQAIRLAEQYQGIYAAIGIHPNSPVIDINDEMNQIKVMLSHPKVVAVGEIGLDYYREYVAVPEQKARLLRQLDLAAQADLPVIIHNREAIEDLYPILSNWVKEKKNPSQPDSKFAGVLHSFSEDVQWAQRMIDMGFLVGVSGVVTFPKARNIKEVVMTIPKTYLLIETDAPYLSPQNHRGKRNEPAFLAYTAQEIAKMQGCSLEVLADVTTHNAKILFGID